MKTRILLAFFAASFTSAGQGIFAQQSAKALLNKNLIVNGDAETDPLIYNLPTATAYGWSIAPDQVNRDSYGGVAGEFDMDWGNIPPNTGRFYFRGEIHPEPKQSNQCSQTIAIAPLAGAIDSQKVKFQASGLFGGMAPEKGNAGSQLKLEFLNAQGNVVGQAETPFTTAKYRQDNAELVPASTEGLLPKGTRSIRVTLFFQNKAGCDNCETVTFADNLQLKLSRVP